MPQKPSSAGCKRPMTMRSPVMTARKSGYEGTGAPLGAVARTDAPYLARARFDAPGVAA